MALYPHRFRHPFSRAWLERGGAVGDLMELNGWVSPQMLTRYGASARGARARRSHDRVMTDTPDPVGMHRRQSVRIVPLRYLFKALVSS